MVAFALNQGVAQESGESTSPPKTTERAKQMPFRGDKWEVVTLNVTEKPDEAQSKETEKQKDS
jgi:hypothetical protein